MGDNQESATAVFNFFDDRSARMSCLHVAMQLYPQEKAELLIEKATMFYNFVKGETD